MSRRIPIFHRPPPIPIFAAVYPEGIQLPEVSNYITYNNGGERGGISRQVVYGETSTFYYYCLNNNNNNNNLE